MTKPFHKDELVARIHAIVRRSKGHAQSVIQTGDLVVNLDTKTVEVNGARVHLTKLGGPADWAANLENNTLIADQIEERAKVRVSLTPGPHEITAAWIKKSDAIDPVRTTRPIRSSHDTRDPLGIPHLSTFTITGPFKPAGPGDMPSRRRIFTCKPASGAEERCARQILATLVRRAYRGQATDADVERLMGFFRAGRQQRDFERGIQVSLQRVLASPKFVFRAEREPEQLATGRAYNLSDLELASRLSFFLWSSIPDDELLKVAAESRLGDPAVLERLSKAMGFHSLTLEDIINTGSAPITTAT
jgi:hypothetical protein